MLSLPGDIFKKYRRWKLILRAFSQAMVIYLSIQPCQAQQEKGFPLLMAIQADIVDFKVDNLGNIYLLSAENRLK